jgi:RNA polymerase sigma-70 factor, ECF subfamily
VKPTNLSPLTVDLAYEQQYEALYGELKRIAQTHLRRERADHTLSATGLVHEAYVRLATSNIKWNDIGHFRAIAARAMRNILVNHAVALKTERRGGDWSKVTLTGDVLEIALASAEDNVDVLDLDHALKQLADVDTRQAEIVELRFFAGLSIEDVAAAVNLSPATVKRELKVARLFLKRAMPKPA